MAKAKAAIKRNRNRCIWLSGEITGPTGFQFPVGCSHSGPHFKIFKPKRLGCVCAGDADAARFVCALRPSLPRTGQFPSLCSSLA